MNLCKDCLNCKTDINTEDMNEIMKYKLHMTAECLVNAYTDFVTGQVFNYNCCNTNTDGKCRKFRRK